MINKNISIFKGKKVVIQSYRKVQWNIYTFELHKHS